MLYSHAYILMYTSMDSSTTLVVVVIFFFIIIFFHFYKFETTACNVTIGLHYSNLVTLGLPEGVTHDALI